MSYRSHEMLKVAQFEEAYQNYLDAENYFRQVPDLHSLDLVNKGFAALMHVTNVHDISQTGIKILIEEFQLNN